MRAASSAKSRPSWRSIYFYVYEALMWPCKSNQTLFKLLQYEPPPGWGGHGNQLMYGPPRAGGVTLSFCFGISNDKILRFVASFH